MARKTSEARVRPGSGNVFQDLNFPGAQEALAKAQIASQIADIVADRGLTQVQCARILGIDQPKVSALLRGRLSGFSTDRLLRFVTALGKDIEINIVPGAKSRTRGRIRVLKRRTTKTR